MNDFWTTFFYIVVMVAVLIAAYLTTKFISGKSRKIQKGRYINFLDRMPVGKDKNIVLIEVGEQNFLVGVTNQSINLLGQVEKEAIKAVKATKLDTERKGFVEQFRGFINNAKNAQENLKKARTQYKGNEPRSFRDGHDDLLNQMDNAIRRRRDRMESGNEDDEE